MARLRSPPGSAAPGLYDADTPTPRDTSHASAAVNECVYANHPVRTVRAGPCARPAGSVLHRGRGSVRASRALRRHGPDAVVYYATCLRFFEGVRGEWIRALGLTYAEIEERGIYLPVLEVGVRYLKPARYDDVLEIHHRSFAGLPVSS